MTALAEVPARPKTAEVAFSCYGLVVTLSIRGVDGFVRFTVAPIATGWSESCRVGLFPTENTRLSPRRTAADFHERVFVKAGMPF